MQFLIALVKNILPKTSKEIEEQYLSEATNLADLERRQRRLLRGSMSEMTKGRINVY